MERAPNERMSRSFISQDDATFRANETALAKEVGQGRSDAAFGAHELYSYRAGEYSAQQMRARVASGNLSASEAETYIKGDRKRAEESIGRTFRRLRERGQRFPLFSPKVDAMITEALGDEAVASAWGELSPIRDPEAFWESFRNNTIPATVLVAILEQRERRQAEIQKAWEQKIAGWKEEFLFQLDAAVTDGVIPPNAHYKERSKNIQFIVGDPVAMMNTLGRHHGADILSIQVESRNEREIRKTVFHELMHQIAGRVVQKIDTETYDHDRLRGQYTDYIERKGGLSFGSGERGKWLNEGITELLARYLAQEKEVTSYPYEQIMILEIMRSGAVPRKLFIDAYFEDHFESPQNGSQLPAFRALNLAMTKAYGAGWLQVFEKAIKDHYAKEIDDAS